MAADGIEDLGKLDGPVLVFGGAYSNLQALQEILRIGKEELKIPPARTIHTGDVVAYCGQPMETTELLRQSGVRCLMGNCEESVGQAKSDCGCGFPEDSACNSYSLNWYAHVQEQLKGRKDLADWMGSLPRQLRLQVAGRRLAVVHGSPRGISEFVWPSSSDEELATMMAPLAGAVDGVLCGHSGIPFARLLPGSEQGDTRLWMNAGVIGMPANDGTRRVWYALLEPSPEGLKISLRSFNYDAEGAANSILAHTNLVRGYADALKTGIWPSHDILPVEEAMASGVAIRDKEHFWPNPPKTRTLWPLVLVASALAAVAAVALARRKQQ